MNAAKAKKNPAKVKGAVLIMILAVMTVMIILLAGSIAVVYSAHNRAYTKYSESQGYYTARSILDNFFSELSESTDQTDSSGASIGTFYQLDIEHNTVVSKPLCMGRSIELELYRAQVPVKDASGNYLDWFVEYCDKNKSGLGAQINGFKSESVDYTSAADGHNSALYAAVENYYVNLNTSALADYSTYQDFYKQYAPVTTVAAGNKGDTIVYEIPSLDGFANGTIDTDGDGNPDTSSQFGKLSDTGASKAWLTVQVTERILAMGDGTTYADRFKAGKRTDDHIVAKVTAHVIYDGEEMTTTQIWCNNPPPVVDANTGLSTLGPLDTTTSLTAIGDVATLDRSFLELTNNSTYSGNAYIAGSFDTGSATPSITMGKEDAFFVEDTLKINTNPPKSSDLIDGALFYAGRTQLWSSGASFGSLSNRVNLVTRQFESHSDTKDFYGRIFAEKFDMTTTSSQLTQNYVKATVPTGGYTFPNSTGKIHGDVYTNFLGVPADRLYLELDDAAGTAVFHLNYNPVTGTPLDPTDPKRIENMMDGSYTMTVFQGISVINAVDNEVVGGRNILVNKHETYQYTDYSGILQTYDYFRDAGAAGTNAPGTKFKVLGTDCTIQMNQLPTTGKEYQVQIDWSNVNNSIVKPVTSLKINLNVDYNAEKSANVWKLDDLYRKEFKLPSVNGVQLKLVGTNETSFKLPTHRSIYGSYFYGSITGGVTSGDFPKSFDDDTAAFSMSPTDTSHSYSFDDFIKEHAIAAEAIVAGIDTEGPVDISNIPSFTLQTTPVNVTSGGGDTVNGVTMPAWSKVISASGYIPSNGGDNSVYYIDARSSDLEFQLGDGTGNQTYTGTFIVYGNNHVTITVPGNVSGGSGQTIGLGTSGSPFTVMTEEIYSGMCRDTLVIGEPVSGKLGGNITTAPSIDWYFSSKTIGTAKLQTGGSGMTAFCGYIVAPTVFFDIATNINGLQRETWYYKNKIPSDSGNDKYTIFGSVFCHKYTGGQHAGVCYIPRDDSYVDDGSKPLLNKFGMYRTRG